MENEPQIISVKKYKILISDPCWKYKNWADKAHGAAISHYNTMSIEQLKKIPVDQWQDDNCLHFMWCTWPKLNEGMELLTAWGLEYVTAIPWVKTVPTSGEIRRGIGFFAMSAAEVLLVGRKGKVPRNRKDPVIGLLHGDTRVFYAPIRGHSQKPEEVQDWIDRTVPEGPRCELFATRTRPGWDCYGYATGYNLTENGIEKLVTAIPNK